MAEKFKEQAVVIRSRLLRRFTACGSRQIKLRSMQKQDSLFPFTVTTEADYFRVRSVSARLTKKILPCIWYTVSQARELQNFLKNRPEITSPSWDRLEMVSR